MKIEESQITPALATKLLQGNTRNRTLSQQRVAIYAADMAAGAWKFDGAPIRVAKTGLLLDGQHRLAAIVRSGKTVPCVIISGLDEDTQLTIDANRARTFADYLHIAGYADTSNLASLVSLVWKYENGALTYEGDFTKRPTATNTLLLQLLDKRMDELLVARAKARAVSRCIRVSQAVAGCCYMIFSAINAEDADDFYDQLASNKQQTSAATVFARTLNNRETSHQARGLMNQEWQVAFLIKAWNAYREGRDINILRWIRGGKSREAFPVPA